MFGEKEWNEGVWNKDHIKRDKKKTTGKQGLKKAVKDVGNWIKDFEQRGRRKMKRTKLSKIRKQIQIKYNVEWVLYKKNSTRIERVA